LGRVLDSAFAATPDDRLTLEAERARLVREISNLTTGIATSGDIPALATMLKDRDKQLKLLDMRLARRATPDRQKLQEALEQPVADWRVILRSNPTQGRMVQTQLIGPITLHDESTRPAFIRKVRWEATPGPAGLLVGLVQSVASPAGFEPVRSRRVRKLSPRSWAGSCADF